MSFEVRESQQFKIEELKVVIKTGESIDISNIFEELNLYDSLFMPVASGKILIRDAIGLSSKLIFDGNESILISIKKDPNSDIADFQKAYRIYKQSNRREEGLTSEYYILNFVSDELLYSDQKRVNQGYDSTYSGIVENLMKDYLKVPRNKFGGIYESSTGLKKVVIPNLRPLEAIEWCTKRAVDSKMSPNFIFWENITGYNFATLSTLLTKPDILEIKFEPKNTSDTNALEEISAARSVDIVEQTDAVEETRSGVNAGKFIGYDPLTGVYETKQVSYGDHYNSMKHANDNPNVSITKNRDGVSNQEEFDSKKTLNVFGAARKLSKYIKKYDPTSLNKIENYEDVIFQRKSIFSNLTKRRLKIVMPGNFQLSSGFNVFVVGAALAKKEKGDANEDVTVSGKYLIVATRHVIGYDKHETIIEVATTSTENDFVPAGNQKQVSEILSY